ncbi:MAG: glutamate racemase [Hellea sp.]|nr:glutamate racemase [Hellea sp.]
MAHALIFDSGVGGLSVSAEIRTCLLDLQQTYIADDQFRPYGEKSDAALKARLPALLWTLCETVKPDIAVIACNTASTSALSEIRAVLKIPVIGVVPAIKPAAKYTQTGRFAVLGTPSTVRQKYVDKLIQEFAPTQTIIRHGSTKLVSLAEDKLAGRPVNLDALTAEIAPLFIDPKVDSVVLACTHFPLLIDELSAVAPAGISWIDSGQAIARRVKSVIASLRKFGPPRPGPDIALLIGPNADEPRKSAFLAYGFERVVGLVPHKGFESKVERRHQDK